MSDQKNATDATGKSPQLREQIDEILDDYENGQNPHQSEEYRLKKTEDQILALLTSEIEKAEAKGYKKAPYDVGYPYATPGKLDPVEATLNQKGQ